MSSARAVSASSSTSLPDPPDTPSNTAAASAQEELERDIIQRVASGGGRLLGLLVANGLIAYVVYPHLHGAVPRILFFAWVVVLLAVLGLRRWTYLRVARSGPASTAQRMALLVRLALASALVQAFSVAAFPLLTAAGRAYVTVILIGMSVTVVSNTGGYRRIVLAYCLPVLGAVIVGWALAPIPPDGSLLFDRSFAVLMLIFLGILLSIARSTYRTLEETHAIRQRERELNAQLSVALDKAQEANQAKTRFLAAASHDLRQPLHGIATLAAALTLRPLDPRSGHIVTQLNEVVSLLTTQLDGLLDISRLDAGVLPIEMEAVDVHALLAALIKQEQSVAQRKGLSLALASTATAPVVVHSDPALLARILRNLMDNAVKFTPAGGRVQWRLEDASAPNTVSLAIEDTGIGIDAQQQRVFQEFYQVGNAERDRTQGLGLGLSIVARLAEQLGITIRLHSRPGQGTRFTLTLARSEGAIAARRAPTSSTVPTDRFDLCVLVIDDEKQARTSIRLLLEELGCRCIEAAGVDDALALVQDKRVDVDLVLADFRLRAGASGLDAIAALRAARPGLPAALVSGDTAPDRLRAAAAAGIELLHKPLALALLQRVLQDVSKLARSA